MIIEWKILFTILFNEDCFLSLIFLSWAINHLIYFEFFSNLKPAFAAGHANYKTTIPNRSFQMCAGQIAKVEWQTVVTNHCHQSSHLHVGPSQFDYGYLHPAAYPSYSPHLYSLPAVYYRHHPNIAVRNTGVAIHNHFHSSHLRLAPITVAAYFLYWWTYLFRFRYIFHLQMAWLFSLWEWYYYFNLRSYSLFKFYSIFIFAYEFLFK